MILVVTLKRDKQYGMNSTFYFSFNSIWITFEKNIPLDIMKMKLRPTQFIVPTLWFPVCQ